MYFPYNRGMYLSVLHRASSRKACRLTRCAVGKGIRIDVLPDKVLLTIFDFFVVSYLRTKPQIEIWISLVHVCRRWRSLVFGSPRRLNLQLFCTPETRAMDTLDVWPALPLIIDGNASSMSSDDNIDSALRHNNRIHEVSLLEVADSQLEKLFVAMQVSFPILTSLRLLAPLYDRTLQAVPDSFLGGSAPCLRSFFLGGIPYSRDCRNSFYLPLTSSIFTSIFLSLRIFHPRKCSPVSPC